MSGHHQGFTHGISQPYYLVTGAQVPPPQVTFPTYTVFPQSQVGGQPFTAHMSTYVNPPYAQQNVPIHHSEVADGGRHSGKKRGSDDLNYYIGSGQSRKRKNENDRQSYRSSSLDSIESYPSDKYFRKKDRKRRHKSRSRSPSLRSDRRSSHSRDVYDEGKHVGYTRDSQYDHRKQDGRSRRDTYRSSDYGDRERRSHGDSVRSVHSVRSRSRSWERYLRDEETERYDEMARDPLHSSSGGSDLKVHVSNEGRWIETKRGLSPVSDSDMSMEEVRQHHSVVTVADSYDSRFKPQSESYGTRKVVNDYVTVDNDEPRRDSRMSRYEQYDERRSFSRDLSPVSDQNSHTRDLDRTDRKPRVKSHVVDYLQEDRAHSKPSVSTRYHSSDQRLVVHEGLHELVIPHLCHHNNRKGCHERNCFALHICNHFVLGTCKFGEYCTKNHNLFKGQPYQLLSKLNKNRCIPTDSLAQSMIFDIIRKRMQAKSSQPISYSSDSKMQSSVFKVQSSVSKVQPSEPKVQSVKSKVQYSGSKVQSSHSKVHSSQSFVSRDSRDDIDVAKDIDPDFDARNYVAGSKFLVDDTRKKKSASQEELSPVSVEQDGDWEKYHTYDKVSDDDDEENEEEKKEEGNLEDGQNKRTVSGNRKERNDNEEKKIHFASNDLDNVSNISSDNLSDVDEEHTVKTLEPVNIGISQPEDIKPQSQAKTAVPIGMNDPLVFSRPLGNQISNSAENQPLFPAAANCNQPNNEIHSGPMLIPGSHDSLLLPNIALQSLPHHNMPTGIPVAHSQPKEIPDKPNKVEAESNEQAKDEADDKNSTGTSNDENVPELKETIKSLWKFPHKSLINMSVIDFVTETEAYKDEFIAEIVRILLTLNLPYVTLKKLVAVIKEKIQIKISSISDLRKILEMYPNNFIVTESADSDDDGDEETKKTIIKAKVKLGFCEKHGFLPFAVSECNCNALHFCKFFFLTTCCKEQCKFGHNLKTEHNVKVLKDQRLHRLTGEEIIDFLRDEDNRSLETIPGVCRFYNTEKGCYRGDATDTDSTCHSLHICYHYMKGNCIKLHCERSHSLKDIQPLSLLKKYGCDPDSLGMEKVCRLINERLSLKQREREAKRSQQKQQNVGAPSTSKQQNPATEPVKGSSNAVRTKASTAQEKSEFYNPNVPSVCKFYNNEGGCRKKDWGSVGFCFFLHVCEHYVIGDCKFGEICKRSHDFFSGQPSLLLQRYGIDMSRVSGSQILNMLNTKPGAPVEIPKIVAENIDSSSEDDDSLKGKEPVEVEQSSKGGKNGEYNSSSVEDAINHIIKHNRETSENSESLACDSSKAKVEDSQDQDQEWVTVDSTFD